MRAVGDLDERLVQPALHAHDPAEAGYGCGVGFDDGAALVERSAGRQQLEADERGKPY
jgi:hypothetical protein